MLNRLGKTATNRLSGLVLLIVLAASTDSAVAKVNTGTDGVAVHGYDVVAYFLEGRAVRGTSEFEHDWQNAKWHFSSAANKDLFAAKPERYAPQYGGFCAMCLALDAELTDANPKAWTIIDGKLYLNYSMHQRTQWRIRSSVFVKYGDDGWADVVAREQKESISESLIQIAVLPSHGMEASGGPIDQSIIPDTLHEVIRDSDAYALKYSSYLTDAGKQIAIPEEMWPGHPVIDFDSTTPREELIQEIGKQLGVGGVLLYSFKTTTPRTEVSVTQDQFVWRGFFFDLGQNRLYQHRADQSTLKSGTRELLGEFLAGRGYTAPEKSYRLAVMKPAYFYAFGGTPNPDKVGELGADVYKVIDQWQSLSITYADEPDDPSALAYLNRGGNWPFPPTKVDPKETWKGGNVEKTPNLDRLYQVGQDLNVDAVMMWYYSVGAQYQLQEYPVEVHVIDIEKQRVYSQKGTNYEIQTLVRQAFDDFHAGRKGYRIAVLKPAYYYSYGAIPGAHEMQDIGALMYAAIQEQKLFSITHADEPVDPSARSYLNRGGDWPFPSTKVNPKEVWKGGVVRKTPNLERIYLAGQELGVDAVVMWFYKPNMDVPFPVELYVIDIRRQRVYTKEGSLPEASALAQQALSDFLAAQKP